jgi:L-aspartate oxidase
MQKKVPSEVDFLVIGAGIAGLRAAIELAPAGRVLVLAKSELTESATQYAQGGIAVALSDEDEISLHLHDTLAAGNGLCNEAAAQVLVEEGPERIQELIEWGTEFDRSGTKLTFTREGAHSRSRVLHAHGDSTGREIGRALYAKAQSLKSISFSEFEFTSDLWVENGRACGAWLMMPAGERHAITATAVLLATGGLGQVYRETTNPGVATGDGVAMAHRAGAEISDMEFVQFHPTALAGTGRAFLISEAVRGEGGWLLDGDGNRFMARLDPAAELAPRDVVTRAVQALLDAGGSASLSLRHLDGARVRRRFPNLVAGCAEAGLDLTRDLIPVAPAAHYLMGGVATDLHAATSLPGLYAGGECAATGVHGANRLASNSLLECFVFAHRAVEHGLAAEAVRADPGPPPDRPLARAPLPELRRRMWAEAGPVRDDAGLGRLLDWLADQPASNPVLVAGLIADAARRRTESRGGHLRRDFPATDPAAARSTTCPPLHSTV